MEVLAYLASRPGELLDKESIIKAVWPDTFVTDDVLTHAISQLRKAFNDDSTQPRFIQTIPRRGYRLIAAVVRETAETKPPVPARRWKPAAMGTAWPAPRVATYRICGGYRLFSSTCGPGRTPAS